MQLTYRGIRFQSGTSAAKTLEQKSAGVYRGVRFSFPSIRKVASSSNDDQQGLKYRGVSYVH
ncbi:MAG: DUF4278 domain-containing protein [Cyanophyceae cyanobacterium]|mgnify:CR=1 FL=1